MLGRLVESTYTRLDHDPGASLQVRTFRLIGVTTAALALGLVLPMNLLQKMPLGVDALTVLLGLMAAFCAWSSYQGRHYIVPFWLLTILMLDLTWFWNAGSQGSIVFFYFPLLLFTHALFQGRQRWFLAVSLLLNVSALYLLEHRFPELVTPFHSGLDRLLDLLTGVLGSFAALAVVGGLILASHDQEQKRIGQIAAKLAASEQNYREIFNATSDAMFVCGVSGELVDLNAPACTWFGLDRASAQQLSFSALGLDQSPYSEVEARGFLTAAIAEGPQVFEWRCRRRNGELFWSEVALRAAAIAGECRIIATVRDISERKLVVERLHDNEERLRLAMEASGHGWFEMNVQTGQGVSSPEYLRMIGFDPDGFTTTLQNWIDGIHPDDRAKLVRSYQECAAGGSTRTMEYRRRTKQGNWKWIRSVGKIVEYDAAGKPLRMYGTHADITERKELEAQLLHSQRLEAVGTLASGVAHDLNNILTPVLMASGILQERLKDPHDHELMSMLHTGGKRGAAIVRQLLAFSRSMTGDRVLMDPRGLVQEIAQLMRSTLPKDITVVERVTEDLGRIEAEPTQMHQVLMNLCVNARDAMSHGGTLTLELTPATLPAPPVDQLGAPPGGTYAVISVADTGWGVPPEYLERIFDPFFTTKDPGKGTGLGLSTVHGIVKAHRGFVRVESTPGQGAVFKVYLPTTDSQPVAPNLIPVAPPPAPSRPEPRACILVVDDDASVRLATQRRLEAEGYTVLPADGGAEAQRLLRAAGTKVTLVVTDFSMPEMDGPTLVPLLRQIVPSLRIIGVSGTGQSAHAAELKALGFAEVLSKPYEAGELLEAIRRQLARPVA